MHVKELKWVSIDRSLIVGGTDMGILMGVNKWKSRDELIKEKLGELIVEDNDAMYWGRMAEPMVAEHIKNNLDTINQLIFHMENLILFLVQDIKEFHNKF